MEDTCKPTKSEKLAAEDSEDSDLNLIKIQALRGDLIVSDELIQIMVIAEESVNTLCTVIVKLLDDSVEFHIVFNDFPISVRRIIGRAYLRQEQVQLLFRHKSLVIISRPVTPIPFIDSESQAARNEFEKEIKPFTRTLNSLEI